VHAAIVLCVLLSQTPASAPKPVLYCFGASWCSCCRHADSDLAMGSAGPLAALHRAFDVRLVDSDAKPAMRRRFKVQSLPTFVTSDSKLRAEGYTSAQELLNELLPPPRPSPARPRPRLPPARPPPPRGSSRGG